MRDEMSLPDRTEAEGAVPSPQEGEDDARLGPRLRLVGDEALDDATSSPESGTDTRSHRPSGPSDPEAGMDPAWRKELDARLIARIRTGDQDAFSELLDAYQGRVYRMIMRTLSRSRDLAEDLTQEVFLRVHRGLPSFQGDCSFSTWIHRITTNVCISEVRRRKAQKRDKTTISLDAPVAGAADDDCPRLDPAADGLEPGVAVERAELYEACRRAIDALPSLWKVILTLRDLEGKSYEEIAEVLGLPIGTVRSRLHRARSKVRALLEQGLGSLEGGRS